MPAKIKGLGKGFDALLPQDFDQTILTDTRDGLQQVPVERIKPNPEQPRKHFDERALSDLAQSLREHGVLQPLVVTPHGDTYYLIAGERRWRAAQLAGLAKVPVVVRSAEQLERLELALVENVQRVDLSPLEQAASIQYLHEQFSQGYEQIAKRLGKATTTVHNIARLLQLPEDAKTALHEQRITEGHARAILALKDAKAQQTLLQLIIQNGWSVRQAERYVTAQKQGVKSTQAAQKRVATTTPQTEKLSARLKTAVTLRRTAKGGKIEISFSSETELKRIIQTLTKN